MNFETGVEAIKATLATLGSGAGVYRMLDAHGDVLYVGKAKNLKNRVSNYASASGLTNRIMAMVSHTRSMEIQPTATEAEALLLEANLIKSLKPKYNILLRDDKSFPYIHLSDDHDYPQIRKHRGSQSAKGSYFGPFANTGAVNQTIDTLQRAFLLRPCNDSVFKNRTRPCLQYQIKRCSAPCVGLISKADYAELIDQTKDFLRGKNRDVQDALTEKMLAASEKLEFEKAAELRNRIAALTQVQQNQGFYTAGLADADLFALYRVDCHPASTEHCHPREDGDLVPQDKDSRLRGNDSKGQVQGDTKGGASCIRVMCFRGGQYYGAQHFFPRASTEDTSGEILSAFIAQYYTTRMPPKELLISENFEYEKLLTDALILKAEQKITLFCPQKGDKKKLIDTAIKEASLALAEKQRASMSEQAHLKNVAELFGLDTPPERIEAYDNSHISGTHAIGAMIMAGAEGFIKNGYRKFNIKSESLEPGDDYGMMREVFTRRFSRLQKEDPDKSRGMWPSLVLIDGGAGQLSAVSEIFADLGITDTPYVAIAKGPDRNAGREQFFMPNRAPFQMPVGDATLHYLQRLRDEVHRYAIGTHRAKRSKAITKNPLDDIPGIGAARKKALLLHFGSASAIKTASLFELEKVEGLNKALAKKVYEFFTE